MLSAAPASAEDLVLEDNAGNIYVWPSGGHPPVEYDNVTITSDATIWNGGKDYNFDEDNYTHANGGSSPANEWGTGVYIMDNQAVAGGTPSLRVNNNLNITIAPEHVPEQKEEQDRRGIYIRHDWGGILSVGGDTSIRIDNYKHTPHDYQTSIEDDEDFGLGPQAGIDISADDGVYSEVAMEGDLDITMLNGNRSAGIIATNALMSVGGDTTIAVKDAAYYNYGIANYCASDNFALYTYGKTPTLDFKGDLSITTVGGNNAIGINLKGADSNDKVITVGGHLTINASGAKAWTEGKDLPTFPYSVSNYGIYMYDIAGSSFNSATITTSSEGDGVESIGTYAY